MITMTTTIQLSDISLAGIDAGLYMIVSIYIKRRGGMRERSAYWTLTNIASIVRGAPSNIIVTKWAITVIRSNNYHPVGALISF